MSDNTIDDIKEAIECCRDLLNKCRTFAIHHLGDECYWSASRYCDFASTLTTAVQDMDDALREAIRYNWPVDNSANRFAVVYSTDRRYGGPEEGGWYYTYRKLIKLVYRPTKDQLEDIADCYPYTSEYEVDTNSTAQEIILETTRPYYE